MFLLRSFSVNNVENFQINLYVVLLQATSIVFKDHILTIPVFRNVLSVLHSEFSTIYHIVSQFLRMKRQSLK